MTYESHALPTFRSWLAEHAGELDAVMFDVDGVLMIKGVPMPGAAELVDALRARGMPFLLLTNDGCSSPAEKCERLAQSGLTIAPEELVSCGHALAEWAVENEVRGARVRLLGGMGAPCYAEAAGFTVVRGPTDEPLRALVVGEDRYDWQRELDDAFNLLVRHPQLPVLVPNPDDYLPGRGGRLHIGSGAVGRFLQALCRAHGDDIAIQYLGKPYAPVFRYAHHRLEQRCGRAIQRDRVMMLGDSLASDIRGGNAFGYRTGLLLTGITPPHRAPNAEIVPERVFRTL